MGIWVILRCDFTENRCFFIKNLFIIFFLWLKNVISNQIYYNLASNLNKKYLFSPYLFHTENNSSILIRNITNEIPVVHSAVINIIMLMSEIFVVFGLLVFLLYINPLTSLVIFLLVAFISVLYNYIFTDYSIRLGDRKVYHSGQFLKHLMQGLGGIKIVKNQ